MSEKELVDKIVMFRTELERQNAGMGITSLFDTICSYYGEQHRTIESQKEEIERLSTKISELTADHIVKGYEIAIDKNNQQTEQLRKLNESIEKRLNSPEIESLKAITELAVKGLKSIVDHTGPKTGEDAWEMFQEAEYTLSEIERLQNE